VSLNISCDRVKKKSASYTLIFGGLEGKKRKRNHRQGIGIRRDHLGKGRGGPKPEKKGGGRQ